MNTSLNRYKFMMYFKFIFAVIIGFIINPCFSKNIEAQYDVIIPDELLINIQGKSLKKYATFLTKISEDKTGLIHPNYKNSFNIYLTSKNRLDKSFTLKFPFLGSGIIILLTFIILSKIPLKILFSF